MSSILSDFHSLKENQQPERSILVQHSQVQQSSASLQPESGVLVQHNQFQHLQSSSNSTAFIARGGQIFPRRRLIADIVTPFVRSKLSETDIYIYIYRYIDIYNFFFFERTILSARCQLNQYVFARRLAIDPAFMTGHVMFSLYIL